MYPAQVLPILWLLFFFVNEGLGRKLMWEAPTNNRERREIVCKGEREGGFRVSTNKDEHRFIYPLGCLGFDGIILGRKI